MLIITAILFGHTEERIVERTTHTIVNSTRVVVNSSTQTYARPASNPGEFYATQAQPAIVAHGDARLNGSLRVTGDIRIEYAGAEMTLQELLTLLIANTRNTDCERECVHGMQDRNTCNCTCVPGWAGDDCSTPACCGHGAYIDGTCVCDTGYLSSTGCCDRACVHGRDYLGTCFCDAGWQGTLCDEMHYTEPPCSGRIADFCEYDDCTFAGILAGQCAFSLVNYGHDICAYNNASFLCYCGGGYQFDSSDVVATIVAGNAGFTPPLARVCAPYAYQLPAFECTTQACCEQVPLDSCALHGCRTNETRCVVAPTSAGISISRVSHTCDFTQPIPTDARCNGISRNKYLRLYQNTNVTSVRAAVNAEAWPDLSISDRLLFITFRFNQTWSQCTSSPYVHLEDRGDRLYAPVFSCLRTPVNMNFLRVAPCEEYGEPVYAVVTYANGNIYCIAYPRMQKAVMADTSTQDVLFEDMGSRWHVEQKTLNSCAAFRKVQLDNKVWEANEMFLDVDTSSTVPVLRWSSTPGTIHITEIGA